MEHVSIVEAKRDFSKIVNKAAFGHQPVVFTSRGKPKAVIIAHDDSQILTGDTAPRIVRLGGRWRGTPEVSERDLRELRARIWGRFSPR